jgi:hypothetical protein
VGVGKFIPLKKHFPFAQVRRRFSKQTNKQNSLDLKCLNFKLYVCSHMMIIKFFANSLHVGCNYAVMQKWSVQYSMSLKATLLEGC